MCFGWAAPSACAGLFHALVLRSSCACAGAAGSCCAGLLHALVLVCFACLCCTASCNCAGVLDALVLCCFTHLCWSAACASAVLLHALVLFCYMRLFWSNSCSCAGVLHALVQVCFMRLCSSCLLHVCWAASSTCAVLCCAMQLCWAASCGVLGCFMRCAGLLCALVLDCYMRICCAALRACAVLLHAHVLRCCARLCWAASGTCARVARSPAPTVCHPALPLLCCVVCADMRPCADMRHSCVWQQVRLVWQASRYDRCTAAVVALPKRLKLALGPPSKTSLATGHCRVSSSTPIRTAGYSQAAAEPMHRGCMCAACTLPSTSKHKHHHHQHRQHLSCCDVAKLQVYAWHTCLQCNKCSEQIGSSCSSSRCCPHSCFKQQVCPLSRARRGHAVLHAFSVLAALLAQEHQ